MATQLSCEATLVQPEDGGARWRLVAQLTVRDHQYTGIQRIRWTLPALVAPVARIEEWDRAAPVTRTDDDGRTSLELLLDGPLPDGSEVVITFSDQPPYEGRSLVLGSSSCVARLPVS